MELQSKQEQGVSMRGFTRKLYLSTCAVGLLAAGMAAPALAQAQASSGDASASSSKSEKKEAIELEEIVVTGIRKSIAKSLDKKREASSHIEVITAEDVSKYPDVNVAESLSRLPGITIDRTTGGEGGKVAINGIDSRLINVQLNGNPLATANSGASNTDTGRSFNFSNIAPELIGNVEVYKTTEARLDEGGIGGSVIINSRRPFELPSGTLSAALNYNFNLRNKEKDPRGSLLYSYHDDDNVFGVLANISYNKSVLGSGSISTNYQSACNAAYWGGCTDGEFNSTSSLPTVTSGPALTESMLVPQYIWLQQTTQISERKTGQLVIQYAPTEDLEFNLTGTKILADYSSYSQTFQTDLSVNWNQSQAYDAASASNTKMTSVQTNEYGVIGGTGTVAVRMDEYYKKSEVDTDSFNFEGKWTPGDWKFEADIGRSKATGGVQPEYFLSFYGNTSATWSISRDGATLDLAQSATDPSLFKTRKAGDQAGFVKTAESLDKIEYAKFDGQRYVEWGPIEEILFGVKGQRHRSQNVAHFYNTVFSSTGSMADFDTYISSSSLFSGLKGGGDLTSFVGLTQQSVIDYSAANKSPGNASGDYRDAGNLWDTTEETKAAYLQANFRYGNFHGDFGVRYVKTDNEQTYRSTMDWEPWYEEMITAKSGYDNWLPSFNLVYDLTPSILLRGSIGKVMSRPTFSDMSGQIEYSLDRYSSYGSFFGGSGGNPDLKPYQATNYNASFEWYFAPNSLFNVDLFYRDVASYIVRKQSFVDVTLPDAALDYCASNTVFCNGKVSRVQTMLINSPLNGSNAKITGTSVGFQSDIAFGFGIQTNITFLHQKYGSYTDEYNVSGKLPMPYLSKWSYTISPYYEQGPFQARMSYTFRSKYTTQVSSDQVAAQYIDGWGQLDASASYNVNDQLSVNVAAQNILDPLQHPYTTGGLPLSWSKYGTRVTAGLTYRMF
jgi:iron complex outermembrane receptor protein